jgi:biopolymer transport protein ExbD
MHHPGKGKLAKKATREMAEEDPEFQIAPMIDILLVLLVFFMSISSTQVLQRGRKAATSRTGR